MQGTRGSIPGQGTEIPCAEGQVSPQTTTRVFVVAARRCPHGAATHIYTQHSQTNKYLKKKKKQTSSLWLLLDLQEEKQKCLETTTVVWASIALAWDSW